MVYSLPSCATAASAGGCLETSFIPSEAQPCLTPRSLPFWESALGVLAPGSSVAPVGHCYSLLAAAPTLLDIWRHAAAGGGALRTQDGV